MSNGDPAWRNLTEVLAELADPKDIDALLSLLLTYDEKEDVAKRVEIVRALLLGHISQREMAEKIGVSIAKITRGSNALKTLTPRFREFLNNLF